MDSILMLFLPQTNGLTIMTVFHAEEVRGGSVAVQEIFHGHLSAPFDRIAGRRSVIGKY
jgi:hypothetical protein